MKALTYLSGFMIPFLIFYIVGYGLLSKRDIYGDFLKGTEDGLYMVICLCPTLIGLMTAVGVLRASGFLDFCGGILGSFTEKAGMPAEIVPLAVVRLFRPVEQQVFFLIFLRNSEQIPCRGLWEEFF